MLKKIKQILVESGMESNEAKTVAMLLLERLWGVTVVEVLTRGDELWESHSAEDKERLREAVERVAKGEPVQYVLGEAEFCGMRLHVEKGVLIPRKETEELVEWVKKSVEERQRSSTLATPSPQPKPRILDVGTGSGCIAIALAKKWSGAKVLAWDVSEEALRIAQDNAEREGVKVAFERVDVLQEASFQPVPKMKECEVQENVETFDVVVSNPPYVCENEAKDMERNVLEHEPKLALFVPDDTPLLFYRHIAQHALRLLRDGGMLFFEINRQFGPAVVTMLEQMGYRKIELRKDMFGNDRMVKALKVGIGSSGQTKEK